MAPQPFVCISENAVRQLYISPLRCVEWVCEALAVKQQSLLPVKASLKPLKDGFFNVMPCCVPTINRVGVKIVTRIPGHDPTLQSVVNLFDMTSGKMIALVDSNWITSFRTGAMAALSAKLLSSDVNTAVFGFVGLGETATATLLCLAELLSREMDVWLLEYKGRSDAFISKFSAFPNLRFHRANSREELVQNTTVLFSCVTVMNEQFLSPDCYPVGYTCIPVHTKGFQDCDCVFDRVFGDDRGHISSFVNFARFKYFAEINDVLSGRSKGRQSLTERILSYNVGIGLLDVWFASRIYDMVMNGYSVLPSEEVNHV